jgi:broad specificity phosphatase PhoE
VPLPTNGSIPGESLSHTHTVVHDAPLTLKGRHQCALLNEDTKDTFQKTTELLVTSPLKRTIQTMIIGYPLLRMKLEEAGKPVIILPEMQEVRGTQCTSHSG